MKKIVLETKVKIVDDNIEKIIDESQFTQEITKTIESHSLIIRANRSYEFYPSGAGVNGAKGIRIISDIPINLTHTYQIHTYDFGFYARDITLFGGEPYESENVYRDGTTIGHQGIITLINRDEEKEAHVRIIYYF